MIFYVLKGKHSQHQHHFTFGCSTGNMNNSTEPQLPDVPLTYMKREEDLSFLWFASPFFIFVLLDIILRFIHCMRTYQKEKRTIRKQLKKQEEVYLELQENKLFLTRKNCYKCAGDCECIGVWKIDSTTV